MAMKKYDLLVLTDHTNHSSENSLYALVKAMQNHPKCAKVDVATKGINQNYSFFELLITNDLYVSEIGEGFAFSPDGAHFKNDLKKANLADYDAVWLRMPPPLSAEFLHFLNLSFPHQVIINHPTGIYETGSKAFLLNFSNLCPPMKICRTIEDILSFKNRFPIVLKPFRAYGGKGIVRIDGEKVWEGKKEMTFAAFAKKYVAQPISYLGVKFLKNVGQGDKRIIVVNGEIMGASLRLPAKDSWICNVAMGGSSNLTTVDEDEANIVKTIHPTLTKMGIVMYGIDTLVGDDGKRVLSEINTTSIGGLPQIARLLKEPLVEKATDLIWQYIDQKVGVDNQLI